MAQRSLKVVDVFTRTPLLGNPVAVVLDAEGLSGAQMQTLAGWTNLSETTFLLPPTRPEADYRARIFTPRRELPFAGHPSLGTAFAALEAGRVSAASGGLVQECEAGLVPIAIQDGPNGRSLRLTLPRTGFQSLEAEAAAALATALGASCRATAAPALIDVGPKWIVVELEDAAAVLDLAPDLQGLAALERRLGATGTTVFGPWPEGEAQIEVRSFAPSDGIAEDPVCGSGNGAVAVFRRRLGRLPAAGCAYRAAQGRRVGREGQVEVVVEADGRVHIGGACVTVIDGRLNP